MAAGQNVEPAGWRAMFDQAMARIAGRFRRVEPRATVRAFVLGLLSGIADEVRDEVRSYVLDHLGGDGVLIVDEAGS